MGDKGNHIASRTLERNDVSKAKTLSYIRKSFVFSYRHSCFLMTDKMDEKQKVEDKNEIIYLCR